MPKNISQKSIFSATFDESRRIVTKKILTENGTGIGVLSSMTIWKRIQSLCLLIFAGIMYVVGAWMPLFVVEEGQKNGISESTIKLILMFGNPMIPVTKIIVIIFVALILLNLFPKGNYAFQLAYGYIIIICFTITYLLVMLPISLALTISSFGWVGLVLEIICCVYLWKVLVISSYQEIKNKLYKGTGKIKNWDKVLMKYIKRYGPILLLLSIINRWTFNFGGIGVSSPGFASFIIGWIFIFIYGSFIFMLGITLQNFISAFYFIKYRKEYRKHFNISNQQWYGN